MAGADWTAAESNPRYCPNCGAPYQGHAKKRKCSNCGKRVTLVEHFEYRVIEVEPDTIKDRIKEFVAEVGKGAEDG